MKHSVHIFLSKASEEVLLDLRTYVAKYADNDLGSYFRGLLCTFNEKKKTLQIQRAIIKPDENLTFTSNIDQQWESMLVDEVNIPEKELQDQLTAYIQDIWTQTLNLNYTGNENLQIYFHIPLFESDSWKLAERMLAIIHTIKNDIDIDIIGYWCDLSDVFNVNEKVSVLKDIATKTRNAIVAYRKKNDFVKHFVLIQNCNENGLSLSLSRDTFGRLLGEFALMGIENYDSVFEYTGTKELQTMGMSMLNLDAYYFIQYMLQCAFLRIIKQENVQCDHVELTEAAKFIDDILKDWVHLKSDFFNQVFESLAIQGYDVNAIMPLVNPKIADKFTELYKLLTDKIINNNEFSLPQKKAMLSALLCDDDELFLYDTLNSSEQLVLMDLERESLQFFIDENNKVATADPEKPKPFILPPYKEGTATARLVTDDIKKIRYEQRNLIAAIRRVEDELEKVKNSILQHEERSKCLIHGGKIVYKDKTYHLFTDKDIVKLDEDYVPKQKASESSVDLTSGFTTIRSQGQQGSCLSHSLVAVMEYFMKQNNVPSPDLSEQFLYYNARKEANMENENAGTNVVASVATLIRDGICSEEMWPYTEEALYVEPSKEAYDDAQLRKVVKAYNVPNDIETIKAVLAEGYPVVFAVRLFNSFTDGLNGFIPMPSKEDLQSERDDQHSLHAMVLCGFNEENKVFKVRNSWGTDFGDNGYCYLPYQYFEQYVVPMSTVITQMDLAIKGEKEAQIIHTQYEIHLTDRKQLNFSESDMVIQYELRRRFLEREQQRLAQYRDENDKLVDYYESLKIPLKSHENHDKIRDANIDRLNKLIADTQKEVADFVPKLSETIKAFKFRTFWTSLIAGLASILFAVLLILSYRKDWVRFMPESVVLTGWRWFLFICLCIGILFLIIYLIVRIHKRITKEIMGKRHQDELNRQIIEYQDEIDKLPLKMNLAGSLLEKFFDLTEKMLERNDGTAHFLMNLKTWQEQAQAEHQQMLAKRREDDATVQDETPHCAVFVSLLHNPVLETYFEQFGEKIVGDLKLSTYLETYKASEEGIIDVQQSLKKDIVQRLKSRIEEFILSTYLSNIGKDSIYKYLPNDFANLKELLKDLERRSKLFAHIALNEVPKMKQEIFVRLTDPNQDAQIKGQITATLGDGIEVCPIASPSKMVFLRMMDINLSDLVE